jgi:translation initiation factor 1
MPGEKGSRRLVYSTRTGRVCEKCGWPAADCRCSARLTASSEPVPDRVTAKLRVENRASGKVVTVIDALPDNAPFLDALARELKKSCGTGGRVGTGHVELQGDHRERLRELLGRKGWIVKG